MTDDAHTGRPDDALEAYVVSPPPAPPERPRRRRGATVAVAAGTAALLVAGVLALATINDDAGGETPEAAVRQFIDAAMDEDALGAMEALVPAERDILIGRVGSLVDELGRLGILDEDVDLSAVPGADLALDGLELRSEALSEDVASVLISGEQLRLAVTTEQLPLGPLVDPVVASAGGVESPTPVGPVEARLVAVRQGGDWFVSLLYSMAEALRRDAGAPVPNVGSGVEPRGEASPEAAIREMVRAITELDARRLVELTPPGEGAALHAYAPLFLDAAEKATRSVKAGGLTVTIDPLELSTKESGDEARVTVERVEGAVSNGDERRTTFSYDGKCVRLVTEGEEPFEYCADDDSAVPGTSTFFGSFTFTTVREGGQWYVSSVRSWLDAMLGTLRDLDRSALEAAIEEEGPEALFLALNPIPFELLFLVGRAAETSSGEVAALQPAEQAYIKCLNGGTDAEQCVKLMEPPPTATASTIAPRPLPTTTTVP